MATSIVLTRAERPVSSLRRVARQSATKSDFDAYLKATEGMTAPASVHLASWIRETDAHDLAHLAFQHPNADDTELRIAEFFTQRGRVFEDRDDMKAPGVQVDLANESLILAVHQSRPEALRDYVADVGEDTLIAGLRHARLAGGPRLHHPGETAPLT